MLLCITRVDVVGIDNVSIKSCVVLDTQFDEVDEIGEWLDCLLFTYFGVEYFEWWEGEMFSALNNELSELEEEHDNDGELQWEGATIFELFKSTGTAGIIWVVELITLDDNVADTTDGK